MKRIISLLLALAMVMALALLAASCARGGGGNDNGGGGGGPEEPCTDHIDTDGNLLCDECGADLTPEGPSSVNVTFTVSDTDGNPLAGFTVMLKEKDASDITLTKVSGTDGSFTATLTEGEYEVYYDYDIDTMGYYISETSRITVSASNTAMTLYLVNNTPNGTAARPFSLTAGEDNVITIPAGVAYYYIIYRSQNYYFSMTGMGAKVSYSGTDYTPSGDGVIEFPLLGTDSNSTELVLIENTSDTEKTFTVKVNSAPGTMGNPIVLEQLGTAVTANELEAGQIIYYTYVAEADGVFMITLGTEDGIVKATNARNSLSGSTEDGNENTVTIEVKAGDEIIIEASAGSAGGEVSFLPEMNIPMAY